MDSAQGSDLALFIGGWSQSEKLFEIKSLYCFYENNLKNHLFDPVTTKIEIFALLFQHFWLKRTLCSQPCVLVCTMFFFCKHLSLVVNK